MHAVCFLSLPPWFDDVSPPPAGFEDHQVENSTFHIQDQHNTTEAGSYHRQKQTRPAGKVWGISGCLLPFSQGKSGTKKDNNEVPRVNQIYQIPDC